MVIMLPLCKFRAQRPWFSTTKRFDIFIEGVSLQCNSTSDLKHSRYGVELHFRHADAAYELCYDLLSPSIFIHARKLYL
jgi:hypothetical protein